MANDVVLSIFGSIFAGLIVTAVAWGRINNRVETIERDLRKLAEQCEGHHIDYEMHWRPEERDDRNKKIDDIAQDVRAIQRRR